MRPDPSECPHCRAAPAQRVACWHGTPRPAPARIVVDVRLVLDREDRTRVYVDGRALLAFSSAAAGCTEHAPPAEQLAVLRGPLEREHVLHHARAACEREMVVDEPGGAS